MDPEKITNKTIQAINDAVELAKEQGHTYTSGVHLAIALFSDKDGVGVQLLQKLSVNPEKLIEVLVQRYTKIPKVTPAPENRILLQLFPKLSDKLLQR